MAVAVEQTAVPEPSPQRKPWALIGLFFLGLYVVATIAPSGALWGLHALGFLPVWARVGGLALCVAMLWPTSQRAFVRLLDDVLEPFVTGRRRAQGRVAVALAAFIAFYAFAIRTDMYGDSTTILRAYADNRTLPAAWLPRLFSLDVLSNREALTLMLHQAIAHLLGIPIGQAFRLVSALAGTAYVSLWLLFVGRSVEDTRWRVLLALVGLLAGGNQLFFGHVEAYPFASLTSLLFLLAGWNAIRDPKRYWVTPPLLLLCIASHPASLYFVPAFVVLTVHVLARRFPSLEAWLGWRRLFRALIVPSLIVGLCLYLFYFRSFAEPYAGAGRDFEHTFLPLVPAPPPLDHYTLQSFDHWRDLANVLLLVGTPVIVALGGLLLLHFKHIAWREPALKYAAMALFFPLVFFVAVNPELSMPRDWDMFALLGPSLLVLLTAVLLHSSERVPRVEALATSLAFGAFSVAFWALNASPRPLAARLEVAGEYVFTTYHTSASYILNNAPGMDPDVDHQLARREATLHRLSPYVIDGDAEYTNLLTTLARMYRDRGDLGRGAYWCEQ